MFNGVVKALGRIAEAMERVINWAFRSAIADEKTAQAVGRTAVALERIATVLEKESELPMAERCGEVGLQISIENEPTNTPQGGMRS